ncbi:hypothetical protein FQN55_006994 [Onygenales sp. PD_40]|nr:hypothetical protein FQN55_006994 [Onygenales sp. PD_40]KAK2803138.1 hypothetical protein FQN51_003882 [Onygenales sp. PD_10]
MQLTSILLAATTLLAPVYSRVVIPTDGYRHLGLERRAGLDSCSGKELAAVEKALATASTLAAEAAKAAVNGDAALFESYFKTADPADRQLVADRYEAIAREAAAGNNGNVTVVCGVEGKQCGKGSIASAFQASSTILTCPTYHTVSADTRSCGGKDHALIMIHELSHLSSVFSPGTGDRAYSYNNCMKLNKEKAMTNADTFLYYANAIKNNCEIGEGATVIPDWLIKGLEEQKKEKENQQNKQN